MAETSTFDIPREIKPKKIGYGGSPEPSITLDGETKHMHEWSWQRRYFNNLQYSTLFIGTIFTAAAIFTTGGLAAIATPLFWMGATATLSLPVIGPAINKLISNEKSGSRTPSIEEDGTEKHRTPHPGKNADPRELLRYYKENGSLNEYPDIPDNVSTRWLQRPSLKWVAAAALISFAIAAAALFPPALAAAHAIGVGYAAGSALIAAAGTTCLGVAAIGASAGMVASAAIPSIHRRIQFENYVDSSLRSEDAAAARTAASEAAKAANEEHKKAAEELKVTLEEEAAKLEEQEQRLQYKQSVADKHDLKRSEINRNDSESARNHAIAYKNNAQGEKFSSQAARLTKSSYVEKVGGPKASGSFVEALNNATSSDKSMGKG